MTCIFLEDKMIRKRIINYRGNSQKRKTLNIASIEECRIFAYYLYEENKIIDHMRSRGFNKPTQKTDSLIASIALANHMVLVTRNTKHFEAIQQVCGLEVENWFQQAQPAK